MKKKPTKSIKPKPRQRRRTLTMLVVPANHPDDIDGMGFAERREKGGGWHKIELLHPGEPDVLLRRALDLDQGVYAARPEYDHDEKCVVQTSLICADDLAHARTLLQPHLRKRKTLARRLVEFAETDEDPDRVARALAGELKDPARGPAEEAAAYARLFIEYTKQAQKLKAWNMGLAWEVRTPTPCECATREGTTPGHRELPDWLFEALAGGRYRCQKCRATYTCVHTASATSVERE